MLGRGSAYCLCDIKNIASRGIWFPDIAYLPKSRASLWLLRVERNGGGESGWRETSYQPVVWGGKWMTDQDGIWEGLELRDIRR